MKPVAPVIRMVCRPANSLPKPVTAASFNLAYGSAMASIGLTIPAIAVASIWLDGPLVLGLGSTQIGLLFLSAIVGALTQQGEQRGDRVSVNTATGEITTELDTSEEA